MSTARLCVATICSALATTAAAQVSCLHDPVVTYTNGMRLASTTSQRSHHVYWGCDVHRTGYCNGRMHGCLRNDLRSLGTRSHGGVCFRGPQPGPVNAAAPHALDGLEVEDSERLGTLRFDPTGVAGGSRLTPVAPVAVRPALSPTPAGAGEGSWLSELQRLGEKMGVTSAATLP